MKKRDIFFSAVLLISTTQTMVDLIVLTQMDLIEVWFLSCMIGVLITVGVGALLEEPKKKKKRKQLRETRMPVITIPEDMMYEIRREAQ